jgi:hypothetical protein
MKNLLVTLTNSKGFVQEEYAEIENGAYEDE